MRIYPAAKGKLFSAISGDAAGPNILDASEDEQENGFVYELEAFRDSFCKGETECPQMPLRKTIAVARWMEAIEKESAINR